MRRFGRMATFVLVSAGLVFLEPAVATAQQREPAEPQQWLPEIADSASLGGDPIIALSVEAAPANTRALLLAWPDEATLERMQVGDNLKLVPVAKAEVSAQSTSIRLDPSANIRQFQSPVDGTVNFSLVITSPSSAPVVRAVSRQYVDGAWRSPGSGLPQGEAPGPNPLVVEIDLDASRSATEDDTLLADSAEELPLEYGCSSTLETLYSPSWAVVGEAHNHSASSTVFTYTQGASSTLGVGISSSGAYGSFSASGSSTKSASATVGFPTVNANTHRYFKTQFRYGRYRVLCVDYSTGWPTTWYEARVKDWIGGQSLTNATEPSATYCTSYLAGGYFERTTGSAVNWTNGLQISGSIGINLSAKTGYSTTAKTRYNFSANGSLCGTNNYPTSSLRMKAIAAGK